MGCKVNFGKCLEMLLSVRGWSAGRLAREINVDASYSRKWIRGTRVPSLQNDYVKQIADSLASGLTLYNKDSINNAFIDTIKNMDLEVNENLSLNELLFECLSKTQIYSLRLTSDKRQNKLNTGQVENLVELTMNKFNRLHDFTYSPEYKLVSEFQNIPLIIHGKNNILSTAISIIKAAIEKNRYEKTIILLTFQCENEVFYGPEKFDSIFDYEIKNALTEGVDVYQLFRLNKNINRSFKIINKIINFLGCKGKYLPYYFNKYGTIKFPMEYIICEGVGALICFSSNNNENFDTAIFYSQEDAVISLKKYLELHFVETSPLVEDYSLEEHYNYITETRKHMGDNFSFENELSTITYPYSLWVKFLNRSVDDENIINKHLARIYSIIQSFYEQVEQYNFCSIINKQLIEQAVKTGKYPIDTEYRKYYTEDIVEHFENIVLLLKKYNNYKIALISDNTNTLANKIEWSVKEDYSVSLHIFKGNYFENSLPCNELTLHIKERTIASSFKDYFFDLWDKIPPIDKDKQYVIGWFEKQISILKKQLPNS